MNNVYYDPEKFGLSLVHVEDVAGSWEFDMIALWKDSDGRFFMASDSGCSCPIPFEMLDINDLTRVFTLKDVKDFITANQSDWRDKFSEMDFTKAAKAAGMVGA